MDLTQLFEQMPFANHMGIEVIEAADGTAVARLELDDEHSSHPGRMLAHGGVAFSLADTVAGAAIITAADVVAPTIDMRIDYLAPATGGTLTATAEVVRNGASIATVVVEIVDDEGTVIATTRGTFKTSGVGLSAWTREDDGE